MRASQKDDVLYVPPYSYHISRHGLEKIKGRRKSRSFVRDSVNLTPLDVLLLLCGVEFALAAYALQYWVIVLGVLLLLHWLNLRVRIGRYRIHAVTVLFAVLMFASSTFGYFGYAPSWWVEPFHVEVLKITPLPVDLSRYWLGYLLSFGIVYGIVCLTTKKDGRGLRVLLSPVIYIVYAFACIILGVHLAYIPIVVFLAYLLRDLRMYEEEFVIGGAGILDALIVVPLATWVVAFVISYFVFYNAPVSALPNGYLELCGR